MNHATQESQALSDVLMISLNTQFCSSRRKGGARVSKLLETTLGDTPAANAIVAAEWRKS